MGILNYTTEVPAIKSAGEIQGILAMKGAHSIGIDYQQGEPVGLMFRLMIKDNDVAFRLPSNWEGVFRVMQNDKKIQPRYKTKEQAKRVSWRILKDWVEAQMAIIESGQTKTEEVFLPYAMTSTGQTLFQKIQEDPVRLLGGGPELRLLSSGERERA